MNLIKWSSNASGITPKPHIKIQRTFFEILRFIKKTEWSGACHAASSVLYILLREQKFDAELYVGEVGNLPIVFDHSWVEIDNKIYDAAITSTLIEGISFPPIFAGIDLETSQTPNNQYGIHSGQGYDPVAQSIIQTPFGDYLSMFPAHPKGLWGVTKDIGKGMGLRMNLGQLKSKYSDTEWKEKV